MYKTHCVIYIISTVQNVGTNMSPIPNSETHFSLPKCQIYPNYHNIGCDLYSAKYILKL